MATTLVSPGVSVSWTDDTSYSSGTGTTPLIIFATQENKTNPAGNTATGTLSSNANKLYYISTQKEAVTTFGAPIFYTSGGTALDGYELNEFGLHALYQTSALAPCYALRADIDLSVLVSTSTEPKGEPADGTFWLNPAKTTWGLYQSNGSTSIGSAWTEQDVTSITESSDLELSLLSLTGFTDTTTAIITDTSAGNLVINNTTFALTSGLNLTQVVSEINGNTSTTKVSASIQYVAGKYYLKLTNSDVTGTITIDYTSGSSTASTETTLVALGLMADGSTSAVSPDIRPKATIGSNGDFAVSCVYVSNVMYQKVLSVLAGDANASLATGMWYIVGSDTWKTAKQNDNSFYVTTSQKIPADSKSGDVWFNISASGAGLSYYLQKYDGTEGVWDTISVTNYQSISDVLAAVTSPSKGDVVGITPYTIMDNTTSNTGTQSSVTASSNLLVYNGSYWTQLTYTASSSEPTTEADSGTIWYNDSTFIADIMVNEDGDKWVGYLNYPDYGSADPNGPILSGSQPTEQSNGNPLANGDIWIDTSDTENYPVIYRYNGSTSKWVKINNTDQITPNGIVFADARATNGSGSTLMADLVVSDFVDPDAPNPELYPEGTLLFNTRLSTNNVKEFHPNYFTSEYGSVTENGVTTYTDYTSVGYTVGATTYTHLTDDGSRWVTVSGNYSDGSPRMGRHAQRYMIVNALQAAITDNDDILSDIYYYSLIACPGYPELNDTMVTLSDNIKNRAFVIGDTPSRLEPTSASITSFVSSTNVDPEFNAGGASAFLGLYYPWGKGTNYDGTDIVIPPSTMMLRVYINNDANAYPWYPAAGYTRGLVDNASNVGYIDPTTDEYVVCMLNQSQRDLLYTNNINPIAYMVNKGLVVYGEKTRYASTTALDRINTARLVCYLNYQLEALAKPYLFELNTPSTRASAKTTFEKFFTTLYSESAILDYIVVCDTSNNTDSTIDAHELYIDVAIAPTSSIEFIYIPVRLENPGTNLSSLYS